MQQHHIFKHGIDNKNAVSVLKLYMAHVFVHLSGHLHGHEFHGIERRISRPSLSKRRIHSMRVS